MTKWTGTIILSLFCLMVLFLLFLYASIQVNAHSFYPPINNEANTYEGSGCCDGRHCAPAHDMDVEIAPGGFMLHIPYAEAMRINPGAGGGPQVDFSKKIPPEGIIEFFPLSEVRQSPDNQNHVCVKFYNGDNGRWIRCLWLNMRGT